jgi:internalin A
MSANLSTDKDNETNVVGESTFMAQQIEDGHAEAERRIQAALESGNTILDLSGLELSSLPESLGQLTQLQELYAFSNQLSSLPESLGQLTQLQELYAFSNQLSSLPESLGQLTQLQELYAFSNQLSSLPESLGQLTQLQGLYVADNQLSSLPESLGQLTQLQGLDVSGNQLRTFSQQFLRLLEGGTLKICLLHDNPHLGIPPEILGPSAQDVHNFEVGRELRPKPQNPARIARYLRQLEAGPTRPLNEAKLLVVGPGEHGKSSLIEFLRDGTFQKGRPSTQGVDVMRWPLPGQNGGEALQVNVWDFGGQEIQHSTHEFFLTERAVYLLVFCPRDDQATTQGLYYWIDLIHTVAPEAPVIVALSKQDEYEAHINDANDLKRLHPKIVDFIPVSCEKNHKCAVNTYHLRELVQQTIRDEVEHIHYKLPATWMAVKACLEAGRQSYLSYPEYQKLCVEKRVNDPEDQKLLARFLHDLGTMLNYGERMPLFEDTHILNPAWVTDGVYAVVLSQQLKDSGGVLSENLLPQLLNDPRFNGAYPAPAQRFILEMMLNFKLCYPLARNGPARYLVPNALPEAEPEVDVDLTDALRFEIHFPRIFLTSVMSRFIVAMHSQNENDVFWRLGIRSQMHGHDYVVRAHPKERKIRIAVAGSGRSRVSVLDYIRQQFAIIFREKDGLEPEEFTFPPGHPDAKPYLFSDLLEAEKSGQREIWVSKAGNVNVRKWLDGITDLLQRRDHELLSDMDKQNLRTNNYYINKIDNFAGEKMGDTNNVNNNINAPVAGNVGGVAGRNNTQTQTATGNQQNIQTPEEMRQVLEDLRNLITEARQRGMDADDCDNAEEAVAKLVTVSDAPEAPTAKKEARGALAMLKGVAEGMGSYADIAEKFNKIVQLIEPALPVILASVVR